MSAHRAANDMNLAITAGHLTTAAPATGGTFSITKWGQNCTVGAGTFKLPDDISFGVPFFVKATGSASITDQDDDTVATLYDGHAAMLLSMGDGEWAATYFYTDPRVRQLSGDIILNDTVVYIGDVPTSDPSTAGQIWANSGVLTVSAG